ncbi:hypothetical protein [Allorhodopirellula solitaria]|nr:hypothetical protein [Allorhodopirellula solitaria]
MTIPVLAWGPVAKAESALARVQEEKTMRKFIGQIARQTSQTNRFGPRFA